MKKQIRHGTFETNSSSVHTLTVSDELFNKIIAPSHLPMEDGYIITDFGDFEDDQIVDTQEGKLSYLMTCLYYINHWEEDVEEHYLFYDIERTVCEYVGAKGIKLLHKSEPQINHQARPDWDISIIDVYNKKQLLLFIFADDIQLDIDHD